MFFYINPSSFPFLFRLAHCSDSGRHIPGHLLRPTIQTHTSKGVETLFLRRSGRRRSTHAHIAEAVFVLIYIFQLVFNLVLRQQPIASFEFQIYPVMNIVMTNELQFIFSQAHEKHLQTHREIIFILRNS
jgi:hypothetical protein